MNLIIASNTDCTVVQVDEPRLDAAIALGFKDRMREIIARSTGRILLDLGAVAFLDSSGLGAIIAMHKAMPPGRQLELSCLTPNVARVFRLTHMDSVFTIHDTIPLLDGIDPAAPVAAEGPRT